MACALATHNESLGFVAMQSLLKIVLRYLAAVAASEAGELLSVRGKERLLKAAMTERGSQ